MRFQVSLVMVAWSCSLILAQTPRVDQHEDAQLEIERTNWFRSTRAGPDGLIPARGRTRAFAQMRANVAKGILGDAPKLVGGNFWTSIGPSPLYDGSIAYAGRVTALAAHPTNPDVLYLGSANGGVWKTTDSGANWQPLTDQQDSLAIGSIALAPSNPDIIYVGTGAPNGGCDQYFGAGVLKSTDGGSTWALAGGEVFSGTSIAKIVVHPTNPNVVWAVNTFGFQGFICANGNGIGYGVWKSTDGGTSWTRVLQGDYGFGGHDLVISPTNPDRLWAGMYRSGVWLTLNGGTTWSKLSGGLPSVVDRIDLAVEPGFSSTLYALIASTSGFLQGIYRSYDGGSTWVAVARPSGTCEYWDIDDLCSYAGTGAGNCGLDLAIEVGPTGAVWAGGLGMWRSHDGGATWADVCPSEMHVGQHAIAFAADGKTWVGNDGGAFLTPDDGELWLNRNTGLVIAEFHPGAALHPTKSTFALAGTRGNGSLRYFANTWAMQEPVGDGSSNAIDLTAPSSTWYVSHQKLSIFKTVDGGASYTFVAAGISRSSAAYIAPFAMCPGDPSVLIAGTRSVWRTNDGAGTWALNSPNPILDGTGIQSLAFAPASTCTTYFAIVSASIFRTTNAGASWNDIAPPADFCLVSEIAIDTWNPNVIYAACGAYGTHRIYRTVDGLSPAPTWTPVDGGLPDTPVNAVLIDPDNSNVLYIGTDIGVFRTTDAALTWSYFMNGHPRTPVFDLVADSSTQMLVSFTHGRGAYRLASNSPAEPSATGSMRARKGVGASVVVTYGPACGAIDHVIYWGATPIVGSPTWTGAACALGRNGNTSFDPGTPPSGTAYYFVVVGQNATKEGSYGKASSLAERAEASGVGSCDKPQDLMGVCSD